MPKSPHSHDPASDPLQIEALAVARSIQKPGQTKEQTRLIAQGIAKGIEQYKRQQSAKARERDKARKRHEKARQTAHQLTEGNPPSDDMPDHAAPTRVLQVSGAFMLLMAALHGLPLYTGWSIHVGAWILPLWVSVITITAMIALALWTFRSASANHR